MTNFYCWNKQAVKDKIARINTKRYDLTNEVSITNIVKHIRVLKCIALDGIQNKSGEQFKLTTKNVQQKWNEYYNKYQYKITGIDTLAKVAKEKTNILSVYSESV